jgi:hypothetical protein
LPEAGPWAAAGEATNARVAAARVSRVFMICLPFGVAMDLF